jgi:hypothetical protein
MKPELSYLSFCLCVCRKGLIIFANVTMHFYFLDLTYILRYFFARFSSEKKTLVSFLTYNFYERVKSI